jgi:eukaryotic-like serine/threonine-protein kinase
MTAESWLGQTIASRYRVDALLGKGGMGIVVRARHVHLDEVVAIKLLLPEMLTVQGMVTRFLREARAASKIKSQHVVRVTDVDVLESGIPYMVMEYLDGVSLAAVRRRQGRLEVAEAVRCLLQACEAIAEAHSLGIIHRDLKPANLFLARCGDGTTKLKVLDFGISKIEGPDELEATKTGQIMGSPKYMSPEQMLSAHDVDGRTDIWSLGAILYELVVGRAPFLAETTPRLCALVLHGSPAAPRDLNPELPVELEAIILRCLDRDAAKRFATVGEMANALRPFSPDATLPRLPGIHSIMPPSEELASYEPQQPAVASPVPRAVTVSLFRGGTLTRAAVHRGMRFVAASVAAASLLIIGSGFVLRRRLSTEPIDLAGANQVAAAQPPPSVPEERPAVPTPPVVVAHEDPPAPQEPARGEVTPAVAQRSATGRAAGDPQTPRPRTTAAPKTLPPKAPDPGSTDPFGGKRR